MIVIVNWKHEKNTGEIIKKENKLEIKKIIKSVWLEDNLANYHFMMNI